MFRRGNGIMEGKNDNIKSVGPYGDGISITAMKRTAELTCPVYQT
jgi:hypothetical protein